MGAQVPDGAGAVDEVVGDDVVVGLIDEVVVWVGTAGGALDDDELVDGIHCE